MFDIAFHGDGGAAQIKDIAERQGIPPRFLEQIFQDLRRAGLVSSKRGPRGGYQLARPARELSVGDVVRALEGPITVYAAGDEANEGGEPASIAVTEGAFRDLSVRIESCFNEVSLEDLCDRAQREGVKRTAPGGYVYVI
jgi:Rrf2 family transcriptional regulator, iron-sulfur cluster assembly transcription factor